MKPAFERFRCETFRNVKLRDTQARRQDSVTGGAEINFGGAREVYFV